MSPLRIKVGVYVLEGVNALATSLYFNYLFFHMQAQFGFTNLGNLTLCAINGFVYAFAAWMAGRYAQKQGYFHALKIGFTIMGAALLAGSQLNTVQGQFLAVILWTIGMCFTWPTLEALTCENEPPRRLQKFLGIYNMIWALGSGLANFMGGAMLEKLGKSSIFLVPAALHILQIALVLYLEKGYPTLARAEVSGNGSAQEDLHLDQQRSPVPPETFLKMAWVANPFAYIAINALLPVIPKLAERFALSPMFAGFVCSVWFFSRALAFLVLWQWTGWHYRFRYLIWAYVTVAVCFTAMLLSRELWVLVVGQALFGAAVGLLYYSSLFYSMDVGETKGEHGGLHESAIGVGIFTGPAIGAVSLRFFPESPNMNAFATAVLLGAGLVSLLIMRYRGRNRN